MKNKVGLIVNSVLLIIGLSLIFLNSRERVIETIIMLFGVTFIVPACISLISVLVNRQGGIFACCFSYSVCRCYCSWNSINGNSRIFCWYSCLYLCGIANSCWYHRFVEPVGFQKGSEIWGGFLCDTCFASNVRHNNAYIGCENY